MLNPRRSAFPATVRRALGRADHHADQQRRLALTAIGVSVERAVSDFEQLRNAIGRARSVHHQRSVCADTVGQPVRNADRLRCAAHADGGAYRDGLMPPALSVNPSSLSFSTQQPGVASAPQTVTVSNIGGAAMANVGFQITGPAAASYSIGATTCGPISGLEQLHGAGGLYSRSDRSDCGHAYGVVFHFRCDAGFSFAQWSRSIVGWPWRQPRAVKLSGRRRRPVKHGPAGDDHQHQQLCDRVFDACGQRSVCPFAEHVHWQLAAGANCTAAVIFQPTVGGPAAGALTVSSAP